MIVKLKLARETPTLRRETDHPLVYLYEEPGDRQIIDVFPHSLRWEVTALQAASILNYKYEPQSEASSSGFILSSELASLSPKMRDKLEATRDGRESNLHALVPTILLTQGNSRSFVGFISKNIKEGQPKNPSGGDLILRVDREDLPSPPCAFCPNVLEMLDGQCSFFTYPKCVTSLTVATTPYFGSK